MVAVNGIDTDTIVTQLMAVERHPQDLMKASVSKLQSAQNAWQQIADKLTALKTAADQLSGLNAAANLRTATSGNPATIAVRSIGPGANVSSSIDVTQLAAAHSVLASDTFAASSDPVAGRTLTLTSSTGVATTVTSADGSIGGLAAAVNAAGIGVNAKVLQTAPGQYQLSLAATATGTAAAFSASGTGWGTFSVVRQGADAKLSVDGVQITRASNVISDVIDGAELTLNALTTSSVTVTTSRDDAAIADRLKAVVTAANALGTLVAAATKTGATAAERGPLSGDFNARQLIDSVRDTIASSLTSSSGSTTTASAFGVSLNKDGSLNFDQSKLTAALATNAADVLSVLGRSATSTAAGVGVSALLSSATPSTRTVTVTQAATQASLVGVPSPPPPAGTTVSLNIVTPTGTVNVTFQAGATWAETAGNLNAGLRAAGAQMTAVPQAGSMDLVSAARGSGRAFTVNGGAAVGLSGTATDGVDAAGTIDGVAFTATGTSLSSSGVVLDIGTTAAQLAAAGGTVSGTFGFTNGLAGALATIGAKGSINGAAQSSKATLQDQVDDLQKRIADYDIRLAQRELVLRTKFTAMQDLISKLQANSPSLGQLATG
jgi:flagellar hook-associated protein 2